MGNCLQIEEEDLSVEVGKRGKTVKSGSVTAVPNDEPSKPKGSVELKKARPAGEDSSQKGKSGSASDKKTGSAGTGRSKPGSGRESPESMSNVGDYDGTGVPPAKRMRLKDLQVATNNFDESLVLGEGSFGKVYKGHLDETRSQGGSSVIARVDLAVKKLNPASFQGYDEWLAEVLFLDKLRHPNLVRLVGYCSENGEALLAYELCPLGSLDQVFFAEEDEKFLTWKQRVKVALDAAQGLAYLHEQNVIHRDFKPSNILLDIDLGARLTDFGMAKEGPEGGESHISTRVMGTLGYLDPAYMQSGRLTKKSDTYSYGVMLLELLSGRRSEEENLTRWARPLLAQRRPDIQQIIDPRLGDNFSRTGATKMAILAKHCIDDDPVSRPEMQVLVESVRRILTEP